MQTLADRVAEDLFERSSQPFQQRILIVPDLNLKPYLFQRFAFHTRLKIAAGVQVLTLNQAIARVLGGAVKKVPSFLELSLCIEERIYQEISSFSTLQKYLEIDDQERRIKRISALADTLSSLFVQYGLYSAEFLTKWLEETGWQQSLWKSIFYPQSSWTYPLEQLKNACHFDGKLALFGFFYLCPAHVHFFASLGATFYHLSPCAQFWQDCSSEKEQLSAQKILHSSGAKPEVQAEILHYMQASHPLLGNWGQLTRKFLKTLDQISITEEEIYKESTQKHLLGRLKRSMLYLEEEQLFPPDDSIQLHSAPSKLREVEICRDGIKMALHEQGLQLSDIVVVSPDIASYFPYIEMVFSQEGFAYTIDALPIKIVSEVVDGFLQLIELGSRRFSLDSVIKLLQHPCLMQKWGWDPEKIQTLHKWFKSAKIRRDLSGTINSWEKGSDRLLLDIPSSEIGLFNEFLELFFSLKRDLSALNFAQSAADWLALFLRLATTYFAIDWEKEAFFQDIRQLALSTRHLHPFQYPFQSIVRVLHFYAGKQSGKITSSYFQKITFTSLNEGKIPPARLIWCLGMHEGAFPRTSRENSLCEIHRLNMQACLPLPKEIDRAIFLELFLKAQDYLIFSYERTNSEDGKEQNGCILLDELNPYLQKTDHPILPFDKEYFSAESRLKKYNNEEYVAAQAHYTLKKENLPLFVPASAQDLENTIDIRQLKKLARHPVQFYFNETLKMYLEDSKNEEDEEFLLPLFTKAILRKKGMQKSLTELIEHYKHAGHMPQGLFGHASEDLLKEETQEMLDALQEWGLQAEQIVSVHFLPFCRKKDETDLLRTPLEVAVDDKKVSIIGELEGIGPEGFVVHAECGLKNFIKIYPLYLIYCVLYPEKQVILWTKKAQRKPLAFKDPQKTLGNYLQYYYLAKASPSPLMPEWAKSLLCSNESSIGQIENDDAYLQYIQRRQGTFQPDVAWFAFLKSHFEEIAHAF